MKLNEQGLDLMRPSTDSQKDQAYERKATKNLRPESRLWNSETAPLGSKRSGGPVRRIGLIFTM